MLLFQTIRVGWEQLLTAIARNINEVENQVCTCSKLHSITYSKWSKISNTFHILFSKKVWVIRAGIHKIVTRIANGEDPGQTDLGVSRPFCQATSFLNFRTFTVTYGKCSKISNTFLFVFLSCKNVGYQG